MNSRRPVALILVALLVLAVAGLGFCATSFIDDRVKQGSAYGFTIGMSPEDALLVTRDLRSRGDISDLELGRGSSAFSADLSLHDPTLHPHWQLVIDPDMWVDTIYLSFENDRLVEIWRVRSRFELP